MANKFQKSMVWPGLEDTYFFLPLVTDEDENKVLGVINGEWEVIDAPASASVTISRWADEE